MTLLTDRRSSLAFPANTLEYPTPWDTLHFAKCKEYHTATLPHIYRKGNAFLSGFVGLKGDNGHAKTNDRQRRFLFHHDHALHKLPRDTVFIVQTTCFKVGREMRASMRNKE